MEYKKRDSLIDKESEKGLLLFDTVSGRMVELNPVAKLLWKESGNSFDVGDLREIINKKFGNQENTEEDLKNFIETAKKFNLIVKNG